MPTTDDQRRLRKVDVLDVVRAAAFPTTAPDADAIGIEAEWFPVLDQGQQTRRLLLEEPGGVSELLAATSVPPSTRLQVEPGAQVEVATSPSASAMAALAHLDDAAQALSRSAAERDVILIAAGQDLWHDEPPPQQSREPRYPAMDDYLARRGPAGAVMMRHTASLQINIDLGRRETAAERWAVSLLASPLSVATFAASPDLDGPGVSRRARTWAAVDPTRTGIPRPFVAHPEWTPAEQLTKAALDADVMLVRDGSSAAPGVPGWTFRTWIDDGHPVHGWPTAADLRYHLTTLFHEVRPRGWLELRSVDALPPRWREAAVVLHAGLLLDRQARQRVLEVLEPQRPHLAELLAKAADRGVADPSLCALAVETWSFALDGAARLNGSVSADAIRRTERFLDEFTLRGRCPADALRDAHRQGPAVSRRLVTEPAEHAPSRR